MKSIRSQWSYSASWMEWYGILDRNGRAVSRAEKMKLVDKSFASIEQKEDNIVLLSQG